ncbi:MAG: hypothetical protein KAJ31_07095 [Deltaproteobacteria bacterium]|nr:hypothetical protein [Deltaproteobacteria bacterium]
MKGNLYIFIFIAALFLTLTSCTHQWQDPDTSLATQSISIASLISSRDAYDSSGVSLIGKVWNLQVGSTKSQNDNVMEETYTTFILADRMGTGVDVYAPGEVPIAEGDFVRVVGIYRKEFQNTGDYFSNVVDAVRIEEWNPGFNYWIREFEFD